MKPGIIAAIIVASIVGLAGVLFVATSEDELKPPLAATESSGQSIQSEESNQSQPEEMTEAEDTTQATFTSAEVAMHAAEDDCWTIINGDVYDITSYIPRHPGGSEILRACGTDGTTLFTQRQTDSGEEVGSGTPHSSRAASQLATLKIGTLEN